MPPCASSSNPPTTDHRPAPPHPYSCLHASNTIDTALLLPRPYPRAARRFHRHYYLRCTLRGGSAGHLPAATRDFVAQLLLYITPRIPVSLLHLRTSNLLTHTA